jgi:hypothetical protein
LVGPDASCGATFIHISARRVDAELLIEDLCALRDANLADDQSRNVRDDPDVAIVAAAEGADDAEVLHD